MSESYSVPSYDATADAVVVLVEFQPDPDLLDACNAAVAVERDVNSSGQHRTRHKGSPRDYAPVTGLGDVPVILGQTKTGSEDVDGRPVMTLGWQALFPYPITLDVGHRLKWEDPDRPGTSRYLYVTGRSYNAFQLNHHWYCPLVEYVEPLGL